MDKINVNKKRHVDINFVIQQKRKEEIFFLAERIEKILESNKSPYERKIVLFNLVKKLEVGVMPPEKKKRTNWLLQGHLYNELAKQCMDEYKKTTVEAFSKN